jgi:hypothetical protein
VNLPLDYRKKCTRSLFSIYYDRETCSFFYKCLLDKDISSYIKINRKYYIKKRKYFQIGNKVFYIEPTNHHSNQIKIVITNDPSSTIKNKEYVFNKTTPTIHIGRGEGCQVSFIHDNILSKIQCTVMYDDLMDKWAIVDGDNNKTSTNGTWLYCHSKYKIVDTETYFKIGRNIILVKKEEL